MLLVDQTLGSALVNSGFFAVHTVFSAIADGQVGSPLVLWDTIYAKVSIGQ